jgi:flavin-dependent dehydrogenase
MEYFDTIIIGAGLAGCTLGNLLLNKKQTVMIVESQDLKKKNKLCGGDRYNEGI